jgi:hypothetical protein
MGVMTAYSFSLRSQSVGLNYGDRGLSLCVACSLDLSELY